MCCPLPAIMLGVLHVLIRTTGGLYLYSNSAGGRGGAGGLGEEGIVLHDWSYRGLNSSKGRPITFVTVHDSYFQTNLGTSPLWRARTSLPHEWLLLVNRENRPISHLYSLAHDLARHDLLVFLHPDNILPDHWHQQFMEKLDKIEAIDADWGVLGAACIDEGGSELSSITDAYGTRHTGRDSAVCQAFDEQLLVLRRTGGPRFDPGLPGFDLYGSDIVLTARTMGMRSYLLNVPSRHKTIRVDGRPCDVQDQKEQEAKWKSPEYQVRAEITIEYLALKWCSSGLLPTKGTAFTVPQLRSCPGYQLPVH